MAEQLAPKTLGRYEIVRELGKGAMGIVYEGRDPNIGRRVAIKTARRDVLEASGRANELMERFLREARSAGALNHPNIITIYDAGEQDGITYIAMEFLEGGDLEDYMAKNKNIPPEKAVHIVATLCEALAVAHRQGIVHRDIKPANVIMLGDTIKIADFGIAHMSDSSLTQEGSMIGTPHYMSPEQFQGRKIDGRTDLWAAGVILYEMLTGEKPFRGDSLSTMMTAVLKSEPIAPHELNVEVNDVLSAVIMKSLSKAPSKRYETGDQMAAAIREALKDHPDPAITKLAPAAEATLVGDATEIGPPDATLITQDAGATAPGAPPPAVSTKQIQPREAGAARQTQVTAPTGASPVELIQKKPFPVKAVGIGVAVVLVLAIVGFLLNPFGGTASNGAPSSGGDAPYFGKIMLRAWLIDTPEVYNAWMDNGMLEIPTGAKPAQDVDVKIKTATGEELKTTRFTTTEPISLPIEGHHEKFEIVADKRGYEQDKRYTAGVPKSTGDELTWDVVLVKEGVKAAALELN